MALLARAFCFAKSIEMIQALDKNDGSSLKGANFPTSL